MLALYKNIKARRIQLGMSQQELADKAGYTDRSSIAKIETGKVDLTQSKIKALANALQTTASQLMGDTENKPLVNNDEELTDYLEELKNRKELRMLFSISKNCTKEEVEQAVRIIEALHKKDDDEI